EQVLRADVVVVEALRFVLGKRQDLAGAIRELVEAVHRVERSFPCERRRGRSESHASTDPTPRNQSNGPPQMGRFRPSSGADGPASSFVRSRPSAARIRARIGEGTPTTRPGGSFGSRFVPRSGGRRLVVGFGSGLGLVTGGRLVVGD